MNTIFNSVPAVVPKKNLFNMPHEVKTTFEMGQLVPFFCEPVIPNDTWKINCQNLLRFAPTVAPVMANIDVYIHFFYVPTRLIWKNWEEFITQARNGKALAKEELPEYPKIRFYADSANEDNVKNGSLLDYLGFQTINREDIQQADYVVDALPFRAYQKIFFDYYRDQNLSEFDDFEGNATLFNSGEFGFYGDEDESGNNLTKLRYRAWKKDYFTSALPFAQKGDDVLIPGQPTGDIVAKTVGDGTLSSTHPVHFMSENAVQDDFVKVGRVLPRDQILLNASGDSNKEITGDTWINTERLANTLRVETLGNPDESTIRDLRRAYAAQRFLERKALGGSRYIEQNLAFFGIKSSDARLQRAEFLGGLKQPVVVSQVLQTSQTTQGENGSPLGQPAGNLVSASSGYIFNRTFEEYGYIIGIISVVPKADYMNGTPRKYLKFDPFDYYWPQFAKIGEQPIYRQELFYDIHRSDAENNETFGYTPRYAEYRFINNHVHGDFKGSLDFWTLARKFDTLQKLNEEFITCKPDNRIFAYTDNDFNHIWAQIAVNAKAIRPITKYGESY